MLPQHSSLTPTVLALPSAPHEPLAAGGHNVVTGLYDYLAKAAPGSTLLGFVGGTLGLFAQKSMPLTADLLADYRNQGGYHLLGRSVDRIRTAKEQEAAVAACSALNLDGLVLIGGTHTNSDAAHVAETALAKGCTTKIIGVPVSIDGDLAGPFVEANLGFDTATKVYAELVGNLETDCNSAKKYYYFVRLMGRQPSHIALEVALQTRPQYVVLGEDIEARKLTLTDIVRELADVVTARAQAGKNFGVVLVPEGAISYIPELRTLIGEMNQLFQDGVSPQQGLYGPTWAPSPRLTSHPLSSFLFSAQSRISSLLGLRLSWPTSPPWFASSCSLSERAAAACSCHRSVRSA